MVTITEDYVTLEVARLLEKKGFNGECRNYIDGNSTYKSGYYVEKPITSNKLKPGETLLPTLQMAMKWLREVHHLYIQVMLDSWACGGHMGYYVVIQKTDSDFEIMLQDYVDNVFYQTYEKACEAAIKYCLENLI